MKKNILNLFNYINMIFHIRSIKHRLADFNSQKELIKNLNFQNQLILKVWHELISDRRNTAIAINAFKVLKCNSSDILLVQSYLKYLLENFDLICRQNDIKYWLRGGSLLGAIRHGAFIPWDDDIDIGMMRDDMHKLESILKNTDFKIVYHFNNTVRQSICRIPRFINATNGINIFIDIFPFDFTDESEKVALKCYYEKRANLYFEISKLVKYGVISKYKGLMYEDNTKDLPVLNEIFDKYTDKKQSISKNIIYPFDWFDTTQNLYYQASDIFPLKEVDFDGINVYIPNDYFLALNMCYDNFLDFPSKFVEHKDCHKLLNNKRHIKKFLVRENIRKQGQVDTYK